MISKLAWSLGQFMVILDQVSKDKHSVELLEKRGYTALDINQLQVELTKLATVFYKKGEK